MKRALLTRCFYTNDGAFGRWDEWVTAEEEWQGNQPRISCIPSNRIYVCKPTIYQPDGIALPTWEVTGVPDRDNIKIHWFNTEEGSEGCITVGMKLGTLDVAHPEEGGPPIRKIAALSARAAHAQLMQRYPLSLGSFELEVRDYGVEPDPNE